jgi:hypothetical protein
MFMVILGGISCVYPMDIDTRIRNNISELAFRLKLDMIRGI